VEGKGMHFDLPPRIKAPIKVNEITGGCRIENPPATKSKYMKN
jgi:hypothetical protein